MVLPSFTSIRRPHRKHDSSASQSITSPTSPTLKANSYARPSESTIKAATRTRLTFSLLTSLFFLVSLAFVILVEIGNTHASRPSLGRIYFFKLDLSHIIPASVPDSVLINSIARTLGLHDFYQVGLWNFCEGYAGQGITGCGKPKTLYWFDPVSIILNELLSGATIALPAEIISALDLVRTVSHWMFGLFLAGACLTSLSIPLTPLSIYTRWAAFPIAILAFLSALCTTVASVIATVMFIIFRNVINSAGPTINIVPSLGVEMFAFMWIASAFAIFGWLVQMGLCCCCASRRDVQRGKKLGRKSAYAYNGEPEVVEENVGSSQRNFGPGRKVQ